MRHIFSVVATFLFSFWSSVSNAQTGFSQVSLDAATVAELSDGYYAGSSLNATVVITTTQWAYSILPKTYAYKIGRFGSTNCSQTSGFSAYVSTTVPLQASLAAYNSGEKLKLCLIGRLGPIVFSSLYLTSQAEYSWTKGSSGQPMLSLSPTTVDFQSVAINGSGVQALVLTNTGTAPLNVSGSQKSGADAASFNLVFPGSFTLAPGEFRILNVQFSPTRSGVHTASLSITSNANNAVTPVSLVGQGATPLLAVNTNAIDFGSVLTGTSTTRQLNVRNDGGAPLSLTSFSLTPNSQNEMGYALSGTSILQPGESRSVIITFRPTVIGSFSNQFSIHSNGGDQTVTINGRGSVALTLALPTKLAFAEAEVGQTLRKNIPITNNGASTLLFENIQISGDDSSDFVIASIPSSIAVGATEYLSLEFRPSDQNERLATLEIMSNAVNSPHLVSLAGKGVQPAILPSDPSESAPPLSAVQDTSFSKSIDFLYEGENAVQKGISPGKIDKDRAFLLRGKIFDAEGNPLSGVTVKVNGNSEYGYTVTRTDGAYDFVINRKDAHSLAFSRPGYISVYRNISHHDDKDFIVLDDIRMIQKNPVSTPVVLKSDSDSYQIIKGAETEDDDGARKISMIIPPKTTATMLMPNGERIPFENGSVNVTEFTVGDSGPHKMPAEMPSHIAYTFAANYVIDEAEAKGAKGIFFSQPIYSYVDDFIGFPTGSAVPSGYLDTERNEWVADENGRVIEILSTDNGVAKVDIDGNGQAETLTTFSKAAEVRLNTSQNPTSEIKLTTLSSNSVKVTWILGNSDEGFIVRSESPINMIYSGEELPSIDENSGTRVIYSGSSTEFIDNSVVSGVNYFYALYRKGPTIANLGLTENELKKLAILYPDSTNKKIWRVPTTHFTAVDYNWPAEPAPPIPEPDQAKSDDAVPSKEDECKGCIIFPQSQSLGEVREITGTNLSLIYNSKMTKGGSLPSYTVSIPVLGNLSEQFQKIELRIEVAGRAFEVTLPPNRDAPYEYKFTWDGKDAYGREFKNPVPASISSKYYYSMRYTSVAASIIMAFGYQGLNGISVPGQTRTASKEFVQTVVIGSFRSSEKTKAGGWNVSGYNHFNAASQRVYLADGSYFNTDASNTTLGKPETFDLPGYPDERFNSPLGKISDGNILYLIHQKKIFIYDMSNLRNPVRLYAFPVMCLDGESYGGNHGPDLNHFLLDGSVLVVRECNRFTFYNVSNPSNPAFLGEIPVQSGTERFLVKDGYLYTTIASKLKIFNIKVPTNPQLIANTDIDLNLSNKYVVYHLVANVLYAISDRLYKSVDINNKSSPQLLTSSPIAIDIDAMDLMFKDDLAYEITHMTSLDVRNLSVWKITPNLGWTRLSEVVGLGLSNAAQIVSDSLLLPYIFVADWASEKYAIINVEDSRNIYLQEIGPIPLPPSVDIYNFAFMQENNMVWVSPWDQYPSFFIPFSGKLASDGEFDVLSEDGKEVYRFSARGLHLRTMNAELNSIKSIFNHNEDGYLTSVQDQDGNVTVLERDNLKNLTAIVGPFGHRTTLKYDASGYLQTLTDPMGFESSYTYIGEGLLSSFTNPRNFTTQYRYDGMGRLIGDKDPLNSEKTLSRVDTSSGYEVTMQSAEGRINRFKFEILPQYELSTNTFPDGTSERRYTKNKGSLEENFGPSGVSEVVTKVPNQRWSNTLVPKSVKVEMPSGIKSVSTISESYSFVNPDDPLSLNSKTKSVTLEALGTWISQSTYSENGLVRTNRTPDNVERSETFDSKGRLTKSSVPGVEDVEFSYNSRGQLIESQQGDRITAYTYDSLGNLASVTNPINETTRYEYDLNGRLLKTKLPNQSQITYLYDESSNLKSIKLPDGSMNEFQFDAKDRNQIRFEPDIDSQEYLTQWTFNRDDQVTQTQLPDGSVVQKIYDDSGREINLATTSGNFGTEFDSTTGEIAAFTSPGGNRVTFTRDGSLVTQVKWEGEVDGSVSYTYGNHFRISSISIGNISNRYGYTLDGEVNTAGDLSISRNIQNKLITGTALGGITTSHTYNAFGEMVSFNVAVSGQSKLNFIYKHDKLGRISSITSTDESGVSSVREFEYDSVGRLKRETLDGQEKAYTYDLNGNRNPDSYIYDTQNRLLETDLYSYHYGRNGSLKERVQKSDNSITAYSYDVLGNLKAVSKAGLDVSYVVDGQNRRIGKKKNGILVQGLLYKDQFKPVAELDGAGNIVSTFVYGSRSNIPDYMIKAGRTYRIVSDHLGSVRLIVDTQSGAIAQKMNYDVWGKVIEDSNPGFQPFGFAGGIYDQDTGLVKFGARDFDAEVGRWVDKDPIRFDGGLNFYIYAENDPINNIDPSGLKIIKALKSTFGIFPDLLSTDDNCTLSGSVVGSAYGASLGSMAGPVGALIGGEVGGSLGGAIGGAVSEGLGGCGGGATAGPELKKPTPLPDFCPVNPLPKGPGGIPMVPIDSVPTIKPSY